MKKEERIKKEKDSLNSTIEEQFQELEKTKLEHNELKEKHDNLQETHEDLKEKHETITMEIKEKEELIP